MNFAQAIRSGFSNYVNFSGRAARSEYWYWALFVSIVGVVAFLIDLAIFNHRHSPLDNAWRLVTFLPGLALTVRRLHDTDRTGWWLPVIGVVVLLLALTLAVMGISMLPEIVVLIGFLVPIYWFCQPGTSGANSYGPDPLDTVGRVSPPPEA